MASPCLYFACRRTNQRVDGDWSITDCVCESETAKVKPDCVSLWETEEKEKEFMCVFVYIDDPAYTQLCVVVCVCVCAWVCARLGAADGGNAVQLIPEESRALQRRCLADLPSSVWLLLAAGVEKKSGTGSESEPAMLNLHRTFQTEREELGRQNQHQSIQMSAVLPLLTACSGVTIDNREKGQSMSLHWMRSHPLLNVVLDPVDSPLVVNLVLKMCLLTH